VLPRSGKTSRSCRAQQGSKTEFTHCRQSELLMSDLNGRFCLLSLQR
jgi:hypothetical protein